MKALDQVIAIMLDDFKDTYEGEYGEIRGIKDRIRRESLEIFMWPEPDTHDEGPVVTDEPEISVLGRYYAMQSPGTVVLYSHNMKMFFHSLLAEVSNVTPYISRFDLASSARLVALFVYSHELFHFDCNVLRYLFGSTKDEFIEEALAVAWSRSKIAEDRKAWQSQIGRMNSVIYSVLMDKAFQFRSPGYCDWCYYADDAQFKTGLLDYIDPGNKHCLLQNGVPLPDIIYAMLGKGKAGQGFTEIVV